MSEGFYTPEADVTEEVGGVQRLVAAKGIPIPMGDARRLGLVKDNQKKAGPSETKEGGAGDEVVPAPALEEAVSEGEPKSRKGAK